jgi:hypothetical protein
MWDQRCVEGNEIRVQANALEANVACAGLALGCVYSSSDEYEAEIIKARRAAGVYGSQYRLQAYAAFVIAAAAIVLVAIAIL